MTGQDVDGALARGVPAVEVLTDYVAACRALGHPTAEPGQLHDAYTAEDGMDLGALDADCAAVTAALGAVDEAVRLQDAARAALAGAWQGPGADAAAAAVGQHAQSSALAEATLRRVADTLGHLRDTLWQLVSGKVAAVQDIEDRAEREQWWPAARAVATGAGAQDTASEIVDGKVNPFVAVAIGSEWDDVMQSTRRSVRDAYDAAAAGISADPPGFGVPAAATTPAAVAAAPSPDPAPVPAPAAEPLSAALPASGLGSGLAGSGMSPGGTGLTGIGQQIADLIDGLLNTASDSPAGDPLDLDEPDVGEPDEDRAGPGDEPDEPDEEDDEKAADGDAVGDGEQEPTEEEGEPAAGAVDGAEPAAAQTVPPTPTPVPEPVPAAPAPLTAPVPEHVPEPPRTPCEIAADELPQAGD
ncbi:uncharacterized protein RMCC_6218 [Mycolicibacterium canariasense]|uniref:Uncharacterized protein n=1 Tax=Mycolicibacterium canariasense TaxID=228230 RepID=A0A100WJN0_MYCCR|nr:hypothetical protein [Mycolicibacterium canariasense]MCV7208004.1 hypothetical protein [Mycolicibacterium canariasense]ORV11129.1 hypothetical protein AWB94_06215 [Mycolicibacterium canariasense]GAS99253.1 uncharacterized protein RMCC_6218 [Mycolicibacterium canariasense]